MRKTLVAFLLLMSSFVSLGVGQTISDAVRPFVKVDAPVIALTHVRVIDGTGAASDMVCPTPSETKLDISKEKPPAFCACKLASCYFWAQIFASIVIALCHN